MGLYFVLLSQPLSLLLTQVLIDTCHFTIGHVVLLASNLLLDARRNNLLCPSRALKLNIAQLPTLLQRPFKFTSCFMTRDCSLGSH